MSAQQKTSPDKITIAALTAGPNIPSSRFRMRQYFGRLRQMGIDTQEYLPYFGKSCGLPSPFKAAARIPALFKSRSADVVWLGKELVQGYITFERWLKRPRVMDVDDAIWHNRPMGGLAAPKIAKLMDVVIAGNSFLADYFSRYCDNIYIVPTAIDIERFAPRPNIDNPPADKFVIGWTGLAYNYKYLYTLENVLNKFIAGHKEAEFMIVSNRRPNFKNIAAEKIKFIQWTPDNEAKVLHEMSVGIMPLADDEWSRGKCSFKMLQYMAAGLPVIVSPVGMNKDVLAKGEVGFAAANDKQWLDALEQLYSNGKLQSTLAKTGRRIVEDFYNADKIAAKLAEIFREIAGR